MLRRSTLLATLLLAAACPAKPDERPTVPPTETVSVREPVQPVEAWQAAARLLASAATEREGVAELRRLVGGDSVATAPVLGVAAALRQLLASPHLDDGDPPGQLRGSLVELVGMLGDKRGGAVLIEALGQPAHVQPVSVHRAAAATLLNGDTRCQACAEELQRVMVSESRSKIPATYQLSHLVARYTIAKLRED